MNYLFAGLDVGADVDVTETAGADFAAQAKFSADAKLHLGCEGSGRAAKYF